MEAAGERDRLAPAHSAARLTRVLLNAERVILEGCGHALLAEQPNPVLDQLIRVVRDDEKPQFTYVFRLHGWSEAP